MEIGQTIDMPYFTDLDINGLYLGSQRFAVTAKEIDCCLLEFNLEIEL